MPALLRRNLLALALTLGAAVVALGTVALLPPQRTVESLWEFLLRLVPFVLAVEALARLYVPEGRRSLALRVLLPVVFLVFFCGVVPRIFFHAGVHAELYVVMLVTTPFFILALILAARLAGAAAATVRRLGYGLLLLMLSGIEDLAFLLTLPHTDPFFSTIPEVWTWASHMIVRIGRAPTSSEAFAFITVHVVAALLVLFAPVPRIGRRRRGTAVEGGSPEAVGSEV